MIILQGIDRYRKEVIQVSKWKYDIKVQFLYNICVNEWFSKPVTTANSSVIGDFGPSAEFAFTIVEILPSPKGQKVDSQIWLVPILIKQNTVGSE